MCSETELVIVSTLTLPTYFDHVEVPLTLRSELEISNLVVSVKHEENETATTEHLLPGIEGITDPAWLANIKLSPEDINIGLKLENQDISSINFAVTGGKNEILLENLLFA